MDQKQLGRMILAEAMTYAVSGCFIGSVLGILLNKEIFELLISSHYAYAQWSVPWLAVLFVIFFLLGTVLLAVHEPLRRIKETSITDTINEL